MIKTQVRYLILDYSYCFLSSFFLVEFVARLGCGLYRQGCIMPNEQTSL